jgi:phosphoglycolate phosphatase-like HAD superfamily hydrolase
MSFLYHFASNPIGRPAPFPYERDMESLLEEHPALLAEHLGSDDAEARVVMVCRARQSVQSGRAARATWVGPVFPRHTADTTADSSVESVRVRSA